MCGRYSLGRNDRIDWEQLGVPRIPDLLPRWNIAPTMPVLAVRERAGSTDGARETAWLKWGLIPSWAKDATICAKLMNARSDTAAEKPSFRSAFKARRCILPADGFFEWQGVPGARKKQPWRLEDVDGRILALGALWERWTPPEGDPIETCTILTTDVSPGLAHIHDRLPVIVAPGDWAAWLSPRTPREEVQALCHTPPDGTLNAWPCTDPREGVEPQPL